MYYLVNDQTENVKASNDRNIFVVSSGEKIIEADEEKDLNGLYYNDQDGFYRLSYYELTTDATDDYEPEQGIPDIPADGTTSATITIQKYSGEDNKLTGSSHDETVHIKTDRGKLSTQSVSLSGGSATFELTSVKETIIANVEVYDPDGNVGSGSIQIQFAPENP